MVRGGYAVVLLARPDWFLFVATGRPPDRRTRAVTRVLGARHLAQALLTLGSPGPATWAAGAEVDALHSATALALACLDPARARAGMVDAAVAGTMCVAGVHAARATPAPAAGPHPAWWGLRETLASAVVRLTLPPGLLGRLGPHWTAGLGVEPVVG